MGKRNSHGDFAGGPRKRQRIVHEAPTSEDVHTSRQLRQLLAFDSDGVRARHGLQSFKLFLDELLAGGDSHPDRLQILREYLDSTTPSESEDEGSRVYLSDIMQTWSHASQPSNDNVISAVVVALALLLKLLSQKLELVPVGLGICRTLLQKRQLELISRALSADKGKAFIISPTLRLLKEAISFDGGAVAKPIFRARAFTLKSLARNMGIVHIGEQDEEAAKRPSARTNAVLFLLNALKFLHPEAKKELLSQRDVVSALTRDLKQDPPYLVIQLLDTLRDYVLLDDKVPREAKSSLLGAATLIRISSLYYYRQNTSTEPSLPSIPDKAHDFLMNACTTPSCGVLRQDMGLYPRETDPDATLPTAELEELGLEAIVWMKRFKTEVPVRNYVLSNFLQNLRPWSSTKQSELVTAIFKAAPELVADFFINNKSFTFEPKLSTTWIGYAAFLFNAVMLPIPDYFCRGSGFSELPPPTSIVIDNILPLPLNQKVLVRCLAHKSKMVSFFATRILVLAVQKLDTAVRMHQDLSHFNKSLWAEAARRLVDEFCQRSPSIIDMINSYRSISEDDILHREAASHLLRLCYEVIPQVALMAKFDVSPFLETALRRLAKREQSEDPKDIALSLKQLENLLAIAGYSPGMRWFSTSDSITFSPFTALLRVYVEAPHGVALTKVWRVLDFVAMEHQLVPAYTAHPGLLPLLGALQSLNKSSAKSVLEIWPFLDKCLTRCATAPIKYLEMMQTIIQEAPGLPSQGISAAVISPITFAILEQLPFAEKAANQGVLRALKKFLPTFIGLLVAAGESRPLLEVALSKMSAHFTKGLDGLPSTEAAYELLAEVKHVDQSGDSAAKKTNPLGRSREGQTITHIDDEELQEVLDITDSLSVDNSALTKWASKTVDELVDEGYAVSLISLLVSEHASIRKEALINILKMAAKIKQSEYDEKEQVWLLLSELAETAKGGGVGDGPLPSPVVAFACHAVRMLKDPLSVLYPKINGFLTRGPVWSLDRLPLVDEVLAEDPSAVDSYYAQLSWLLSYLLDSLRTDQDLELFHKKRANGPLLERLLALAGNSYMRLPLRIQLLKLLYRATGIKGGSTTLTTRFGIVSWLEAQVAWCQDRDGREARLYEALRRRVWETCDRERVGEWSRKGAVVVVEGENET
ncbi:ribosome 60S biogenesis N-terminal-domain-containing protein [Apodospora peruviana]|uniref:Ribosome 60S biogenesis N-terminal-domain-containing protein n=1 Tax=Apodospora peruviana TaxID=516989 RepID=A0AAE0I5G1_9PEZI|nr:ribosome 60S biogenesis N-terminal-domain-containing protein [Apodospora peruviana]